MSTLLPILPPADLLDPADKLSPAAQQAEEEKNRMRHYFEKPEEQLNAVVQHEPVCLYLETTNRCNLLCTTCPRTYEQLEPEADADQRGPTHPDPAAWTAKLMGEAEDGRLGEDADDWD